MTNDIADSMELSSYLANGGILSSPDNVPPRYRAELLRMMAGFVDSELAGAAGFADIINEGPGVKERIAAARIVLEKTDHADQVLTLMGEFGADIEKYASHHAWTERVDRDTPVTTDRKSADMRLAVLNYPLTGWLDAVVMNLLMGKAVCIQLAEYKTISYQPFATAIGRILPREIRHTELAQEGLNKLLQAPAAHSDIASSVAYWWPRVASSFGADESPRFAMLQKLGLRRETNAELRGRWKMEAQTVLETLGIAAPS